MTTLHERIEKVLRTEASSLQAPDYRVTIIREQQELLREARDVAITLNGYAAHDGDCSTNQGHSCSCGYSDAVRGLHVALAKLNAALGEK